MPDEGVLSWRFSIQIWNDPDNQNWGNLAFAIDPDLLVGREFFLKNVDRTMAHIKGLKRTDPARDIHLPGELSFIRSAQAIATQELEINEDLFRAYRERILSGGTAPERKIA
jgi:LDH2 family malate/lactate/ureidoglycolate dehydrogenase